MIEGADVARLRFLDPRANRRDEFRVRQGFDFTSAQYDSGRENDRAVGLSGGSDRVRSKKTAKTLRLLAANPRHSGLNSHRYTSLDRHVGAAVWKSYVENRTPRAWRIWWYYGPEADQITVVRIGPHPD